MGYLNGTRQEFADNTVSATCSINVLALVLRKRRLVEEGTWERVSKREVREQAEGKDNEGKGG